MINSFSIKEVVNNAFELTKKHFWILAGASFISIAISLIFGYVVDFVNPIDPITQKVNFSIISFILILISLAIGIALSYNITKMNLSAVSGGMPKLKDVLNKIDIKNISIWFLIYLIYVFIVFIGLILFIIPGIYLMLRYMFVFYLVIDKNLSIKESFARSTKMTVGIKWNLLGLTALVGLVNIVAIPLLIIFPPYIELVFIPVYIFTSFIFVVLYKKLSNA